MDAPTPPPAPDPRVVAAEQTKSNRDTAISNAYLNRIDQNGPMGRVSYRIKDYGPNGEPIYEQTTSLSPEMQGLFDNYMSMSRGMGDIGISQLNGLRDQLGQPLDLNTAAEENIVRLQRARLDPMWQQREESQINRLAQRGIMPGTEAYDREMRNLGQSRNDAYNQMYLGARQQGVNEAVLQRTQPLQEFNALRTGSQYQMPTFQGVPGVTQANTDVAGINQAAFQNNMAAYNAQNASNNAMMGGLFGLGAAAMPFIFSDRRIKTEISHLGSGKYGLPVFAWKYIWGGPVHIGYMAQDVEKVAPWAVLEIDGIKAINYGVL